MQNRTWQETVQQSNERFGKGQHMKGYLNVNMTCKDYTRTIDFTDWALKCVTNTEAVECFFNVVMFLYLRIFQIPWNRIDRESHVALQMYGTKLRGKYIFYIYVLLDSVYMKNRKKLKMIFIRLFCSVRNPKTLLFCSWDGLDSKKILQPYMFG